MEIIQSDWLIEISWTLGSQPRATFRKVIKAEDAHDAHRYAYSIAFDQVGLTNKKIRFFQITVTQVVEIPIFQTTVTQVNKILT